MVNGRCGSTGFDLPLTTHSPYSLFTGSLFTTHHSPFTIRAKGITRVFRSAAVAAHAWHALANRRQRAHGPRLGGRRHGPVRVSRRASRARARGRPGRRADRPCRGGGGSGAAAR